MLLLFRLHLNWTELQCDPNTSQKKMKNENTMKWMNALNSNRTFVMQSSNSSLTAASIYCFLEFLIRISISGHRPIFIVFSLPSEKHFFFSVIRFHFIIFIINVCVRVIYAFIKKYQSKTNLQSEFNVTIIQSKHNMTKKRKNKNTMNDNELLNDVKTSRK